MKTIARGLLLLLAIAAVGAIVAFRLGWRPGMRGSDTVPSPSPTRPLVTASVTPLAAASPSPLPTRDARVLRVALDDRASAPLFMALPQFIRDHGNDLQLECTIVPNAAERWQLLAAGRVDIATGTLDSFVLGAERHDAGAILFEVCSSAGYDSLVARTATEVSALKGKRIAVDIGSGGPLLLGRFLKAAGLDLFADVTLVKADDARGALLLLQNGLVDAAVLPQPEAREATRKDTAMHIVAGTTRDDPFLVEVCVANRTALEKQIRPIQLFTRHWFELQAQLQANSSLVYPSIARSSGHSTADVAEQLGTIRLFTLAENKQGDDHLATDIALIEQLWQNLDVPNNRGKLDVEAAIFPDVVRLVQVEAVPSIFGASPAPSRSPSSSPSARAESPSSAPSPTPAGEESATPEE